VEFLEDNVAVVQGEVNIDEVNEMLGIDLPEGEEFETLAGFVFNRAGRLVEEGEEIEFDEIRSGSSAWTTPGSCPRGSPCSTARTAGRFRRRGRRARESSGEPEAPRTTRRSVRGRDQWEKR